MKTSLFLKLFMAIVLAGSLVQAQTETPQTDLLTEPELIEAQLVATKLDLPLNVEHAIEETLTSLKEHTRNYQQDLEKSKSVAEQDKDSIVTNLKVRAQYIRDGLKQLSPYTM